MRARDLVGAAHGSTAQAASPTQTLPVPTNTSVQGQPAQEHVDAVWHDWPEAYLADSTISAYDWEHRLCGDFARAIAGFGNHICLPEVCYKSKKRGRSKICRMFFWHWARTVRHGRNVARRLHGLPLQAAWNGDGDPPIHVNPPHRGKAALERTHPFQIKMTPGPLRGPSCNHDLSVLFCFWANNISRTGPVAPSAETASASTSQWKTIATDTSEEKSLDAQAEMLEWMLETTTDHEYYTGGYLSKDQPHALGLLHCLHDAKQRHERSLASRRSQGQNCKGSYLTNLILRALSKRKESTLSM